MGERGGTEGGMGERRGMEGGIVREERDGGRDSERWVGKGGREGERGAWREGERGREGVWERYREGGTAGRRERERLHEEDEHHTNTCGHLALE